MVKSVGKRLAEQRERQQLYRDKQKRERRPSRDDIARMLMHIFIVRSMKKGKMPELEQHFLDLVVDELGKQGFDRRAAQDVCDNLIDKYARNDWSFRKKIHLGEALKKPESDG
ncbi:hypothetical protein [Mycoplana dimorpha]|uniref:Uncharacterized protein n=1 Tax=Mycoplana dimorpha TaxID=28320 RepID=A0A2T5ANU3_MYCDI|nr:hypothetical protein [Mycoplana dimorpha]PTM88370.1 hypothetical protein C7449_1122 [Mycoplana dimorpha]